ncbi:unnamed protein product [Cylicostephanus goldi]|uniref:Uncharacterized protein n=1 Tax=Cylicostephanus goldi TaxID=71465 RepID=A0A3P6TF66_CYLGO|nr:unnamed protein product [Cylicostephanus goldi]
MEKPRRDTSVPPTSMYLDPRMYERRDRSLPSTRTAVRMYPQDQSTKTAIRGWPDPMYHDNRSTRTAIQDVRPWDGT